MSLRILIADDHGLVAEGLRALLEARGGYEVVARVEDGRQAFDRALALRPDVVLMDVMMPQLNGIEAARMIGERLPQTRVIMISMHASAEYVYRALEAGAAGFLVKRAAPDEVFEAIEAVRSGRRFFSREVAEGVIERYVASKAPQDPLGALSPRERQVLQLLAEGRTTAEIAAALSRSPKTVETYRARLQAKLGIDDLAGLVRFAIRHGLTALD